MQARNNWQSLLISGIGVCVQFGAWIYYLIEINKVITPRSATANAWLIYAAGSALMIWGLAINAKGKWLSPIWGCWGVLSVIGAVIVAVQPDLHKAAQRNSLANKKVSELPEENAVEFYCQRCDYQLNGILGQSCPECGTRFNPDDLSTVKIAGTGLDEPPWMGRWSLICGIMGILLSVGAICGPLLGITGIAFGHGAMYQIKQNHLRGFGVAMTGLILSYLALLASAAVIYNLIVL